jgi:hypothetical protein
MRPCSISFEPGNGWRRMGAPTSAPAEFAIDDLRRL